MLTFKLVVGVVMTAGIVIWLLWELFCALSGVKQWGKYQDFEFESRELGQLPRRVRAHVEQLESELLRLDFEPLGTYLLLPWPMVAFGTFFVSRDRRIFAGIDDWKFLRTRTEALTFMSVLEDGTFFESADQPDTGSPVPDDILLRFQYLPGASPQDLCRQHETALEELEQKTGVAAMQFRPEQFMEVTNYGHRLVNHEAHKKGIKEEPPPAYPPRRLVPSRAGR